LKIDRIIELAISSGANAVHPGYGFLAENADFAQACQDADLVFIGPAPAAIRQMGDKSQARQLMIKAQLSLLPGYQGPFHSAFESFGDYLLYHAEVIREWRFRKLKGTLLLLKPKCYYDVDLWNFGKQFLLLKQRIQKEVEKNLTEVSLTILIPVYNEEETILELLKQVNQSEIGGVSREILVVDDGLIDETPNLLRNHPELYTKVIYCSRNGGKGAAVWEGLKAATGDFVLFRDADLEYDPCEYSKILQPALHFNADLVMARRF
jgi:hypothetical protein